MPKPKARGRAIIGGAATASLMAADEDENVMLRSFIRELQAEVRGLKAQLEEALPAKEGADKMILEYARTLETIRTLKEKGEAFENKARGIATQALSN